MNVWLRNTLYVTVLNKLILNASLCEYVVRTLTFSSCATAENNNYVNRLIGWKTIVNRNCVDLF